MNLLADGHTVWSGDDVENVPTGDVCFLLGLSKILRPAHLAKHHHNLVVHESALPQGRGWSPMTWQVLSGTEEVTVSLLEADECVDSGKLIAQRLVSIEPSDFVSDIRSKQAHATVELCCDFVRDYPRSADGGWEQQGTGTWYPRRTPSDSRLDLDKTLREQINLLRVVDNHRYPAFFDHHGVRVQLHVKPHVKPKGKPCTP
jgi:methionyl-tRNA formyltransferase